MFDADRAITSSEQDRLGRSVFAKYLARCILDHKYPESFVIGLYGSWGTGKTSLINLTLEELKVAASHMLDEEKPVILNFSPWSYSGQNQLIYSFFRRLASEIQRSAFVKNAEQIISLLELYISFFTHTPISSAKQNIMTKIFCHAKKEIFGWQSGRDLTLVKAELNQLLATQKHKFIIFIDNIARIDATEIKQIFQIVKSMGDYVNTVYVLAMDKEPVIHALNTVYGIEGTKYLEKVVQLPFDIPNISAQDLENILLDRLYQIVKTIPENSWNNNYWADLYYGSLKYFFKNCRDITRYVNTLNFSFTRVKELVNPMDFFAITALAVFIPEIYYGIRDNKDLFTDLVENVFELGSEEFIENKLRCDAILNRCQIFSQDFLKCLLIRLFPRLNKIYYPQLAFNFSADLARQNRHISSADVFDIYFRLSLPTSYMSKEELTAILTFTNDETTFSQAILRLNKDERIKQFLDLLDSDAVNNIPVNNIPCVVNVLINSADLFPEHTSNPLIFDMPARIHRILSQSLNRLDNLEDKFIILREAFKKAVMSLYILVHETKMHTFTLNQTEVLQKLVVGKIIYWSEIGRLAEHPKMLEILSAWKSWGNAEDCQRFVGKMIQEDRGLLAFLCKVLKNPIDQAMTKLEKNSSWENALFSIENFISVNILIPHAKMIFESGEFEKLTEREQLAILIFLDLVGADTIKIIPKTS